MFSSVFVDSGICRFLNWFSVHQQTCMRVCCGTWILDDRRSVAIILLGFRFLFVFIARNSFYILDSCVCWHMRSRRTDRREFLIQVKRCIHIHTKALSQQNLLSLRPSLLVSIQSLSFDWLEYEPQTQRNVYMKLWYGNTTTYSIECRLLFSESAHPT